MPRFLKYIVALPRYWMALLSWERLAAQIDPGNVALGGTPEERDRNIEILVERWATKMPKWNDYYR